MEVREFVRGTLRLNGWADAWADVFSEIETLSGDTGDARLKEMSDQFWAENAYGENDLIALFYVFRCRRNAMAKPFGIKPMR